MWLLCRAYICSVCLATDSGPKVTAFKSADGSVNLRCTVEFHDVVRTNAYVTWHEANGKPMPLVIASAMTAVTKSPGCTSAKRRRRRRLRRRNNDSSGKRSKREAGSGKYKCRVQWTRPRPYIPDSMHNEFLTLAASTSSPQLELCIATDPCAESKSHTHLSNTSCCTDIVIFSFT